MSSEIDKVASSFEAYFLRRVLSEVKAGEGLGGGGMAAGMFKDMLDEALSDAMAASGSVGLADLVAGQLEDVEAAQKKAQPSLSDQVTALKIRADGSKP